MKKMDNKAIPEQGYPDTVKPEYNYGGESLLRFIGGLMV